MPPHNSLPSTIMPKAHAHRRTCRQTSRAPYLCDPLQPHHEMYLPQLPHAVPLAVGEAVRLREASDKRALNKTR